MKKYLSSWTLIPLMIVATLAMAFGAAWADGDHKHDEEHEAIEEMMEELHEGKKSPLARTQRLLKGDEIEFAKLKRSAKGFVTMGKLLSEAKNEDVKGAADGYADAAKAFAIAVKKEDAAATRAAFKDLTSSCADCHTKTGVGGELHEHDDDHEHEDDDDEDDDDEDDDDEDDDDEDDDDEDDDDE